MNFQRLVHTINYVSVNSGAKNFFKRKMNIASKAKTSNDANFSKEEREEFLSLYPQVVEDITNVKSYNQFPTFITSTRELLDHNAYCGTNARSLITVYAYKMFVKPENLTQENLNKALIAAWILRILEAYVSVMDDFLDNSPTRNQRPCWYSLPSVGKKSALHTLFLESSMFHMLQKYFSSHPQYMNMMHVLLKTSKYFNYSQCLDTQRYSEENMTFEYMKANNFGKSAYAAYNVPVTFAMFLADIQDPELYRIMKKILIAMGHYFQIQNDFLDSFDDPRNRRLGTDVKEARITWLSVTAFHKCNANQKQIFREHFGKDSEDAVSKIIDLYSELAMPRVYQETESKLNDEIWEDIKKIPNDIIPHALFHRLLNNLKQGLCSG